MPCLPLFLKKQVNLRWLLTYDNVPEISKLYQDCQFIPFNLPYSAHGRKTGSELLIHQDNLLVPREFLMNDKQWVA